MTPVARPARPKAAGRVGTRRAAAARRAGLVLLALWWVLPLLPVLGWALAETWTYPSVLPTRWGPGGWSAAWADGLGPAALRSAVLGAAVAAVATPLGALAGRGLAPRGQDEAGSPGGQGGPGHGRRVLRTVLTAAVVLPVAVPPFASVMGLTSVALRLRVPATAALVLVLVAAALPYTTWVMQAWWAGHDLELEDAARTLGASPATVVRRVRLPAMAQALALAAFLAFLVAWGDYVVTLLVGGGRIRTLQQLLGATAAGSGTEPVVAALALTAVLPALLLVVVVVRTDRAGTAS